MIFLQTKLSEESTLYDGTQLRSHWIYETFDMVGDAMVAFIGPANVTIEHMVDLEDVKKKAPISSPLMLHFIGEWFMDSLDMGILLQHLFVNEVYELLLEKGIQNLSRQGNDIYYKQRKLSVSIATRSPVSVLMHTAVNIETEGTPVPTSGLRELDVEPKGFAKEVLARFEEDAKVWQRSRVKVRPR